ncbi:hypothetical protein ASF99_11065 [Exiguobacterium sp. Leaf187]|uniref:Uncharacterized protein n=1 Tax=Exiguobacterium indicum TaxID=296995 RepID=A0A0V8GDR0_9BACL|nr:MULTISPECIES: hypothetical protein [Exiguobacterium]KQS16924.1 hypothetical protein ASF99_11065 [Exiguobacterium sp. Leaf187]KSU48321.1 hypothetical protein AS033_11900 [Exiguobacterium enclense]NTY11026.1 hypothetical protein [Exiguobacterium sp. JMULE1]SDD00143.1 hypothetical protein SAMN05216342_2427 [Exiguobacterium enclense]
MKHRIVFRGEESSVSWDILHVYPKQEELTIQMTGEDSEHEFSVTFNQYDAFIRNFARVHESLYGEVVFEQGVIRLRLRYDRLGRVFISWSDGQTSHQFRSDQSYLSEALAQLGVY